MVGKRKPHPETCERCPNRYSDVGCPFWILPEHGLQEEKPVLSGPPEVRILTGCMFGDGHLMRWMSHGVAAMNRAAKSSEVVRNDIVAAFERLGGQAVATKLIGDLFQALEKPDDVRVIEHKKGH